MHPGLERSVLFMHLQTACSGPKARNMQINNAVAVEAELVHNISALRTVTLLLEWLLFGLCFDYLVQGKFKRYFKTAFPRKI